MGRDHHVVHAEERIVLPGGLRVEHVQGGASQPAFPQGLDQRLLVHNGSPGGVNQQGGGLHQSQKTGAHHFVCLSGEGGMEGHHVCPPEQILCRHQLHARLCCGFP